SGTRIAPTAGPTSGGCAGCEPEERAVIGDEERPPWRSDTHLRSRQARQGRDNPGDPDEERLYHDECDRPREDGNGPGGRPERERRNENGEHGGYNQNVGEHRDGRK